MTLVALVLSLIVAGIGLLGVLSPGRLRATVSAFESLAGLLAASAFRVALGGTLLASAHTSNFPATIQVLGVMFLLAGVIMPFLGLKRFRALIAWWSSQDLLFVRLWASVSLLIGLFLSSAVVT